MKKLGLIINPIAGIGGAVGLKGSDGEEIQKLARERGAVGQAETKAKIALAHMRSSAIPVTVCTAAGRMGGDAAAALGFTVETLADFGAHTTGADTEHLARALARIPVDLLCFAGGDGTARDVCAGTRGTVPVLGIPAGVKIHSGVYAISPAIAGETIRRCLSSPFATHQAEVMDLDEDAYRQGRLKARLYGFMPVPALRGNMQNPKAASHNNPDDLFGLCCEIEDRIRSESNPDICYVFGAGSTVYSIMEHLGCRGTLIGVDVVQDGRVILADGTAPQLLEIVKRRPARLIVTAIGGQGHIFGRGNQQLSPGVIRAVGTENIWIAAAASKIFSLDDQTLYVDTGDETLDAELRGYRRVIVDHGGCLMCRVR
ncbi:MAG: ATP-NAD kinase family protein [Clostridiales Family XIII bacterium]|jgi:predicted polyphosphate/ATP-dependent NAD kinase|nr:ATP-NAD kinase family protein [Clostridiales Family XIII bacterium]